MMLVYLISNPAKYSAQIGRKVCVSTTKHCHNLVDGKCLYQLIGSLTTDIIGVMINLVCVGACYLDTILSVPYFPEEDSKLRATSLSVRRGGNCPNSLEVLQQLLARLPGHDVMPYLISPLPSKQSLATARIKESFGPKTIVNLSKCVYREQHLDPASSYVVRSEATGSRTVINHSDLPDVTLNEFIASASGIDGRAWWHFEVG
ncbi:hypothetical protein BJ170DRAFT_121811 [Xylariales sp. AK1849]|nr:hypothetical protein BJ170DRAFT_121811 [Xylariales sp. AK1849]